MNTVGNDFATNAVVRKQNKPFAICIIVGNRSAPFYRGLTMSKLLNVKEVAQHLNMGWRSVLRHADSGVLPKGFKIGGLRRWTLESIERFVKEKDEKATKS
jgi:predicted DNA-binding transcriptional regulator AlpA